MVLPWAMGEELLRMQVLTQCLNDTQDLWGGAGKDVPCGRNDIYKFQRGSRPGENEYQKEVAERREACLDGGWGLSGSPERKESVCV